MYFLGARTPISNLYGYGKIWKEIVFFFLKSGKKVGFRHNPDLILSAAAQRLLCFSPKLGEFTIGIIPQR
jgi:hypothetical protein